MDASVRSATSTGSLPSHQRSVRAGGECERERAAGKEEMRTPEQTRHALLGRHNVRAVALVHGHICAAREGVRG